MILLSCFTCFILLLNLYAVVMGDLRKINLGLGRNEKELLLEKFLVDAESHLMQNCPSRHTSIIAPNDKLLRAASPIFKGRPCFVGTNAKVMVRSREYASKNCVFVFIDTIDYDYLTTIFSDLPSNYDTKVRILSTNSLLKDEVRNILDLAYDKSIENVTITFLENNEFKAFRMCPFTRSCKREVRLAYVWVPDKGLKTYYYDDCSPRNLNKCSVPISTLHFNDTIKVRKNSDDTVNILGGFEGNIILSFAEILNFTTVIKYTETQEYELVINKTIVGLMGDIAYNKSVIKIGHLMPTLQRHAYSDFTQSYDHVCIVWTTPAFKILKESVLCSEFSTYLWAVFVSSIIFSCIFIYKLSKYSLSNRKRQTYIGVTIDVICATLGIPVQRLPTNRPGKVYFMFYIFCAIIMITAYQAHLSSILTVTKVAQLIKTDADIVRAKLMTGGSLNALSVLQSQRDENPSVSYILDHFEISVNTVAALDRIKDKKDYAFAKDRSIIQYYKRDLILAGKEVYFYSFDKCIISYPSTILVRKGSVLTNELDVVIGRLRESGLLNWWKNEKSNVEIQKAHESEIKPKKLKLWQLESIFILYLSGVILSSFIMLLEIILGALSKKKKSK